jgi:hypothetical protein
MVWKFLTLAAALGCIHTLALVPESVAPSSDTVGPANVLTRVTMLQGELELLRREMGRQRERRPLAKVSDATPREVYFEAVAMYHKADRVAFEQAGKTVALPSAVSSTGLDSGHVLGIVNAALERVLAVKGYLHIPEQVAEVAAPMETTSSDVFAAILQASRQLNLLLDQPLLSSDVYQQVSLAIEYTQTMLATLPQTATDIRMPAYVRRRRSIDAYRRIRACLDLVADIASQSGITALAFGELEGDGQSPSDVYDLATLLVAELAHFHAQRKGVSPPATVHYPGRRFPAHVCQLTGYLEALLQELQRLVELTPDWLQD